LSYNLSTLEMYLSDAMANQKPTLKDLITF
jgi:hypothetical protein